MHCKTYNLPEMTSSNIDELELGFAYFRSASIVSKKFLITCKIA